MSLAACRRALSGDHALAVARRSARRQVSLVDRWLRLLHLQEQRVVLGPAHEQRDEGAEADAAHADDLEREVGHRVPVQEDAPILLEGLAVLGHRPTRRGAA